MKNTLDILNYGKSSLEYSAKNIIFARSMLDESFVQAVELISQTDSKIVLTGIGKSGLIAKKISSTLISFGLLSYYIHPSEARHGDFGIIRKNDIIIAISNSGKTDELLKFIREVKKLDLNNKIISITSSKNSALAKKSDITISTHVKSETFEREDRFKYFPIASSTVTLAIGDALCATVQKVMGLKVGTIALNHPGGTIGKLLKSEYHASPKSSNL